jgi:hypothetical protein
MLTKIYQFGEALINVPASGVIAAFSRSPFKVYQQLGYPNQPTTFSLLAIGTSGVPYASAAFAAATVVKIQAGADDVVYAVGTAPQAFPGTVFPQGAPVAKVGASTLAVADLVAGIITETHATGATVALTLDTGALMDAGVNMNVGEAFDWFLINLSAAALDTDTVTAAASGHTVIGVMIVQSVHVSTGGITGNCGHFRTRKTAANTFVTYRIV